jgi:hypothetical protein
MGTINKATTIAGYTLHTGYGFVKPEYRSKSGGG